MAIKGFDDEHHSSPNHPASRVTISSTGPSSRSVCIMATKEDPPQENQEIYRGHSHGITGHATSHAPILVGPILRVEKEHPGFPHYITS